MSLFLSLECSFSEGSLSLSEISKGLKFLAEKKWTHQPFIKAHSDRIPLEIDRALKRAGKRLSDLGWLAVGTGPGRWTGARTAVNAARALAFALKIPVFPLNSLRICAQPFLSGKEPVLTAFNGFNSQVYFGEFYSKKDLRGKIRLLDFKGWLKEMEAKIRRAKGNKLLCLSDLEDFYPVPESLKKALAIKKIFPTAKSLARAAFEGGAEKKSWRGLKAFYLRSPLD